jgi:hypothetical protein
MSRSQCSAIFANFREKMAFFLKNQCYDHFFANNNICFREKTAEVGEIDENGVIITLAPGRDLKKTPVLIIKLNLPPTLLYLYLYLKKCGQCLLS